MDVPDRFKMIYRQTLESGSFSVIEILKDTKTGVLYLYRRSGSGGGLTVLVGKDGKPLTE